MCKIILFFIFLQCFGLFLKVLVKCTSFVNEFVFNIPPTAKVIWRRDHSLRVSLTDWKSLRSNSGPLGTRQVVYPLHHGSFCKIELTRKYEDCAVDKSTFTLTTNANRYRNTNSIQSV